MALAGLVDPVGGAVGIGPGAPGLLAFGIGGRSGWMVGCPSGGNGFCCCCWGEVAGSCGEVGGGTLPSSGTAGTLLRMACWKDGSEGAGAPVCAAATQVLTQASNAALSRSKSSAC